MVIMTISSTANVVTLTADIHCIVTAHLEVVIFGSLMCDHATVHGTRIVLGNAADHHAVRIWLAATIDFAAG